MRGDADLWHNLCSLNGWAETRLDRPWVIGHSGEGIRPHAASAT